MGVFIWSMGTPDCKDIKIAMGEVHVGFWDLVGVGIAPVSKITAIKLNTRPKTLIFM